MKAEGFRQDKKFYLTVGIALGVLLLALGYDSSIRNAAALTSGNNQELEGELEDTKGKFLGQESIAQKKRLALKDKFLPIIKVDVEFPDTLPEAPLEGDAAVHLRRELTRIQREMKKRAAHKDIDIPVHKWDIGDRIKPSNTPREVDELRLRLSATYTVINECVKSNIRRIRKIEHKKATIEVIPDTTAVVRRVPFTVEFDGDLYSIASVMLAFQKAGKFLEMQGCKITGTARGRTLSTKVHFAAIKVLDRSQLEEDVQTPVSKPTPRGTGRGWKRPKY